MRLIKNFEQLAINPQRKIVLDVIESGLASIQPKEVIQKNFSKTGDILNIQNTKIDLNKSHRVFLLGFGKGSAGICQYIEKMLDKFLTRGYVIDVEEKKFSNIKFTQGDHPLPSETNLVFTKKTIKQFSNLTIKDLIIVVIAGGGSAMFESPYKLSLEKLIEVNKALLKSGANIIEMNILRKHLSEVKGGRLAKLLYPAKIISIIASDVPGNDLSVIASGPTVKDTTTIDDALNILSKYNLIDSLNPAKENFLETPKEDKFFNNVTNILLLSNKTALMTMQEKAKKLGFKALIYSDRLQGEARFVGKNLIEKTPPHAALLVGGETTVKVKGEGIGGRNQEVVLGALPFVTNDIAIASFGSDGWDHSPFAGAIADSQTIDRAQKLNLKPQKFLETNNTFPFFEKVGDGIVTGRLSSNVSDLMIVVRK